MAVLAGTRPVGRKVLAGRANEVNFSAGTDPVTRHRHAVQATCAPCYEIPPLRKAKNTDHVSSNLLNPPLWLDLFHQTASRSVFFSGHRVRKSLTGKGICAKWPLSGLVPLFLHAQPPKPRPQDVPSASTFFDHNFVTKLVGIS